MSVLAADSERFTRAASVRGLNIQVQNQVWHDPADAERAEILTGKALNVWWDEPYGTGWTNKRLLLPVQRVVDQLLADPETAEVVLAAVAAHLIWLLREARS